MPADQVEEMTLTEHDHVIEQLSTKGAYPPFRVPTRETSSSPRHLTASRAVAPTTTPSATGASFAHSHERTCESIWPTACKGSNIRVLQQLSSVPPSPAPVSSPLRTGGSQDGTLGVGNDARQLARRIFATMCAGWAFARASCRRSGRGATRFLR
jgi:hypothetical protein